MSNDQLENLIKTRQLEIETADEEEIETMIASGGNKLADAQNSDNTIDSRFGLAYSAAHALSSAALRRHGYRAKNRHMVFQCLTHTSELKTEQVRILIDAHAKRNKSEYEGTYIPDEALVKSVISVTKVLLAEHEAFNK